MIRITNPTVAFLRYSVNNRTEQLFILQLFIFYEGEQAFPQSG
jgi:hypothetical protein